MLDEKKCYLFGRNPNLNDVCIDHSSCSRIHAALVFHKHLMRFFLIDLSSTHGTFIGSMRLEAEKPTQLPVDSTFHFGASSRRYTLREKPTSSKTVRTTDGQEVADSETVLPESELELDNLTEYNTATNKRVSLVTGTSERRPAKKRKLLSVTFREEEDIINPEDIDPSVGKFRNLIQTAVIPNKKMSNQFGRRPDDYHIIRPDHSDSLTSPEPVNPLLSNTLSTTLGFQLPNPAPDVAVDMPVASTSAPMVIDDQEHDHEEMTCPEKKKKYAKESWPGRKAALF
jgi:nuclear inhibitor of protein phosphatase 1